MSEATPLPQPLFLTATAMGLAVLEFEVEMLISKAVEGRLQAGDSFACSETVHRMHRLGGLMRLKHSQKDVTFPTRMTSYFGVLLSNPLLPYCRVPSCVPGVPTETHAGRQAHQSAPTLTETVSYLSTPEEKPVHDTCLAVGNSSAQLITELSRRGNVTNA